MDNNLLLTILAAIILMLLVVIALAIGRLLTGRNRLRRGTCGMIPKEKGKCDKTKTCSICGAEKICENEDEKKESNSHDNKNTSGGASSS